MSNSIETSFLYRNSPRFRSNSDDEVGAGGKLWGLVLFCGCAAACIALSLVLGSYDYSDPGFSRFNTKLQVSNLFGVQGAWTADLFYLLFGWGAWVFVIGLFYFLVRGLKRLRGKKVSVSPIPMGFRILAFKFTCSCNSSKISGRLEFSIRYGGFLPVSRLLTLILSS